MDNAAINHSAGWKAELQLGLTRRNEKTVLFHRKQRGPLAVQRPFYPEGDICHLYVLHPPGGVVSGDQLHIDTNIESSAASLITTPGATKFYRSAGDIATQKQILSIAENASLEWLPQENIFFPGCNCHLSTEVMLQSNARFIGWEIHCLGRPANDELFETGYARFTLHISRGSTPLLVDQFEICDSADLGAITGLRSNPILATFFATPVDVNTLEILQEKFGNGNSAIIGFTLLEDLLLCRCLGTSTEQARNLFIQIWRYLRPITIQREACAPRIWYT